MRVVTTEAIVLRAYNLAEADRIVVCLTRSAGLVRAVAKGARRMKSRFGAALEPFTLIKLTFQERENRELVTISSTEIMKSNFNLYAQVESGEVLAYMGELIGEFAPPHEADEKMFRMLSACVDALATSEDSGRAITRYFEVWLLRLAGLFPDLRSCSKCGTELDESAGAFVDTELRPHCAGCRPNGVSVLSSSVIRTLHATHRLSPAKFAQLQKLSDSEDAELGELTHRLIARAIDRRPRTLVASTR
jgi:DNA repair protein RecO (recombination protein O)